MVLCGVLAWGYQVSDDRARLAILGFWGLLMISAMVAVHLAERRQLASNHMVES